MKALGQRRNAIASAWLFVLCVAGAAGVHGKVVDDELLDAFERAQERDQLDVARQMRERLQEGRPAPGVQKRLVEVVGQSQNLIKYGMVDMLYYLGPGRTLGEPVIAAAASGLSSGVAHNAGSAEQLARLLIDSLESQPLPATAMSHLYDALSRPAGMNAAYSVRVLQHIPPADPRFEQTVGQVSAALDHDYHYVRRTAAMALAVFGAQASLPDQVLGALTRSATADDYIHVRIESFAALATQPGASGSTLADSLIAELTTPTAGVWEASSGMSGFHDLKPRAITLLMSWLGPPYPAAAIDALIAQTRVHYRTTLPHLESIAATRALSEAQAERLKVAALRISEEDPRRRLYALIAGGSPQASSGEMLDAFQDDGALGVQLEAAYRLERAYQGRDVPAPVAEIARRVLLDSRHPEVRTVAARLLAHSNLALSDREQAFTAALRKHTGDASVAEVWLELYADDQIEDLTRRYAGDDSLRPWTRAQVVSHLAEKAYPAGRLEAATRDALIDVGAETRSYPLNNAVIAALEAWNESVPLSVKMANKQFLGALLFGTFAVLAVVFVVGTLGNLFVAATVPLKEGVNAGAKTAKRTGLLLLWLAITVVGLILFAVAFVGFLGHNSAPDPRGSVKLNIPMYIAMALFLLYTLKNIAWHRQRTRP